MTLTPSPIKESRSALPAAVLWDMDGTLVDTEPFWIAEEFALVERFGGSWNDEHARALVGNDLLVSARYIAEHGSVPLPPEEIVDVLMDGVIAGVRRHVPWRPGAQALLRQLRDAGVPCALVTMSYQRLAQAVIASLPTGSFVTVVAGDDVTHGKPHPEPYLAASRQLGVDPHRCVAIEDSVTGVASAEAAGLVVLAIEHLVPIPAGPLRTVDRTLLGWTPSRLAALLTSH